MKYVNIAGPVDQLDGFVLRHIIDCDIQIEHAFNQVPKLKGLKPFIEENPYDRLVKALENVNRIMKARIVSCCPEERCFYAKEQIEPAKTMEYLSALEEKMGNFEKEIEKVQTEIDRNRQILKQLVPIRNLQFRLEELFQLEYMKIRFGKLPKENFKKLDMVLNGRDVIVVPFSSDDREAWICYSMPAVVSEKIDHILSSLYFERIWISEKARGFPSDEIVSMKEEIRDLEDKLAQLNEQFQAAIQEERIAFQNLYSRVVYMQQAFAVRKYAAHTQETFYLAGWMPERAFLELSGQLKGLDDIALTVEEPEEVRGLKPPTILRNSKFFKPFESIVTMYGIPAHNEVDPTVLIALTYILMFGAMFGDVGQGAVIALAGLYMFFSKKQSLGWVLACVGVSSIGFGFLYGSFFGNEHLLKPVWRAPMENINQLLIISISYGAIIILLSIIINVFNSVKAKDYGRLLFDKNGLVGLAFYGGTLATILIILVKGPASVSIGLCAVIVIIPLILILFKEKLERTFFKHRHSNNGGSFVEGFFEVFEAVLGFLSNTISFVRVSAFALSHAGLALAIWTLYGMVNGAGKVVVLIVGNLLIIGLEGLIVGIQCLRLQYYEMFSRFFSGDGRRFHPNRVCGDNELK